MCSICGGHYPRAVVESASAAMAHRGPDNSATFAHHDCVLAHNRLRIIDLSDDANQPFSSPFAPHLVLVYNGEIFNYRELRAELEREGVAFSTKSDTEVLFCAFAHWGERCLQRLNGDFAFAVLDTRSGAIFLARDRLGNKPLYYALENGRLFFASEIKAFFALRPPRFDAQQVASWLAFGGGDCGRTIYEGIMPFPPASFARFTLGDSALCPVRYWRFAPEPTPMRLDSALDELQELLLDSVRLRLLSDVPVALSVSGGIDSSLIAHCVRILNAPCKLFGVSFVGFEGSDESAHIAELARNLDRPITQISPNLEHFAHDFPHLVHAQDEIFRSFSIYAQFLLFEALAQHCVVALGGQGADELFGGYYHHIARFVFAHKEALQARVLLYGKVALDEFRFGAQCALDTQAKMRLFADDNAYAFARLESLGLPRPQLDYLLERFIPDFEQSLWNDVCAFSLPHLLRYEDRNAMWFGVENRCPFTDYRLVEFAFRLDSSLKCAEGYSKYLLRKLLERLGSPALAWRTDKIGFGAPESALLQILGYNYNTIFDVRLCIFEALQKRNEETHAVD